eukprot:3846207-Prymnesium_polylepis.1
MASGTTTRGSWSGTSRSKPSPSPAWTASKIVSTFFFPKCSVPPRTLALSAAWTGQTSNQP